MRLCHMDKLMFLLFKYVYPDLALAFALEPFCNKSMGPNAVN